MRWMIQFISYLNKEGVNACIYHASLLYEVKITFYTILIKHALSIDFNVKYKVQLIGQ